MGKREPLLAPTVVTVASLLLRPRLVVDARHQPRPPSSKMIIRCSSSWRRTTTKFRSISPLPFPSPTSVRMRAHLVSGRNETTSRGRVPSPCKRSGRSHRMHSLTHVYMRTGTFLAFFISPLIAKSEAGCVVDPFMACSIRPVRSLIAAANPPPPPKQCFPFPPSPRLKSLVPHCS